MSDLIGHKIPATLIPGDGIGPEVLKGPLTTPVGGGFRSSNVRLREEFELLANVRPARTLIPGRFDDIDLVLVRENLGGFYVAHEYVPIGNDPRAVAVSTGINTRDGTKRIARFAFEYALEHGCKKITIVHRPTSSRPRAASSWKRRARWPRIRGPRRGRRHDRRRLRHAARAQPLALGHGCARTCSATSSPTRSPAWCGQIWPLCSAANGLPA